MNYHALKIFALDKLERELPAQLTYHGIHHTLDVLYTTEELCFLEKIQPFESMLLKTAALLHDSGFTIGSREHEQLGCQIAREFLPHFDYTSGEIEIVCGMIMATKIPQSPKSYLEAVLCDADLDYLGRDDFYDIGATLYQELKVYNVIHSEEDWNRLQVRFLENHTFFTPTNLKRRSPRKNRYLEELKKIVAAY